MKALKNTSHQQLLKTTPARIGCYLLKAANGKILYIGKAKNLALRIKTHLFRPTNQSAALLAATIWNWEVILTNTEKEAFILEQNLIKRHLPKYNVILKDDRRYPYIYISSESQNPRYYLTYRRPNWSGLFYGPFPDQYSGQKLLHLLENLFPLKKCRTQMTEKPCFYYQIEQCLGGCWKKVPRNIYVQQMKKIKKFFHGQIEAVKKTLTRKITLASKNLQFEQANRWKKIRDNLTNFVEKQIVEFPDYVDRDFVNYYKLDDQLIVQVFFYRKGKLQHQTHFWTRLYNDDIEETITHYLHALYEQNTHPQVLIVPPELALNATETQLHKVKFERPKQGKKAEILALILHNCQNLMKNYTYEVPQGTKKHQALEKLAQLLKMPTIATVDFIDLSYWNQKDLVIGMISRFHNGWEIKSQHRSFVWEGKKTWSEAEFFANLLAEAYQTKTQYPDLLLLDGSYLQLKGATKISQEIPTIGLIKNPKHRTEAILTTKGKTKQAIGDESLLNFLRYVQETGHLNALKKFKQLQRAAINPRKH